MIQKEAWFTLESGTDEEIQRLDKELRRDSTNVALAMRLWDLYKRAGKFEGHFSRERAPHSFQTSYPTYLKGLVERVDAGRGDLIDQQAMWHAASYRSRLPTLRNAEAAIQSHNALAGALPFFVSVRLLVHREEGGQAQEIVYHDYLSPFDLKPLSPGRVKPLSRASLSSILSLLSEADPGEPTAQNFVVLPRELDLARQLPFIDRHDPHLKESLYIQVAWAPTGRVKYIEGEDAEIMLRWAS